MSCAQCQGIERMFDRRAAERELRQYRAAGPGGTTRLLIDALKAEGGAGLALLDIGGGGEVARVGPPGRVFYPPGGFGGGAPRIEPHDIVTLDRVICCYHALEALVGPSALRARRLHGLADPPGPPGVRAA